MKRLTILFALAALTGCGGSAKPTAVTTTAAPPTPRAQANAICAAYHRQAAGFVNPTTLPSIAVYAAKSQRALGQALTRLAALRMPGADGAALKAFIAKSRAEVALTGELGAAARAGSIARVREVSVRGAALDQEAHALALRANLTACAGSAPATSSTATG
jgi:hypothetical protein